jgi:glycosyltransferase involved in cell wall biosynthesis
MPVRRPRPDWFRAAVESALSQRDCDLELIVVDDGSLEPLEGLLDGIDDPRLRMLRVEHGGPSHARNAGLAEAQGEYLRFVDADDVLEEGSTARLMRLTANRRRPAIAYGSTLYCDENLRPLDVAGSDLQGWIVEECLLYRFDVRHMSMIFPRRVVGAVGQWDESLHYCQDWDYVLRALEHAPVRGEREIETLYRQHGGALTADIAATLDHETLVVDRYFERHPEQVGSLLERRARAQLLRVRAGACPVLGGRQSERLRLLAQAFAFDRGGTTKHLLRAGRRAISRRRKSPVTDVQR